jgi:hypothetical protein
MGQLVEHLSIEPWCEHFECLDCSEGCDVDNAEFNAWRRHVQLLRQGNCATDFAIAHGPYYPYSKQKNES